MRSMHAQTQSKKVSKKVMGLFDKSLILKSVAPAVKRKEKLNKKLKEFPVNSNTTKPLPADLSTLDEIRDLDCIGLVPTIELTEEQATNLVATAEHLREKYSEFGMVKLRLPRELPVQRLDLAQSKKKLTVRQQVLPNLPQGRVD